MLLHDVQAIVMYMLIYMAYTEEFKAFMALLVFFPCSSEYMLWSANSGRFGLYSE